MQSFPTAESTFLLPGPVGNIEILATPAPENSKQLTTAIICHPHPLFGGTMTNKVVTILAKTFNELGAQTIRFNFRGVGKTEGVHDEGRGETDDLLAIIDWVKKTSPQNNIWLAGFSFGGFVATNAAVKINPAGLVTVAPQVSRFTDLPTLTCPWIIVQGEKDEVVAPEEVYAFVASLTPSPLLIRIPEASHFFHGLLLELRERLITVLKTFFK